jgi:serpin B
VPDSARPDDDRPDDDRLDDAPPDNSPEAAMAAARADDALGADLFLLLGARGGNMIFSPASIGAALRMALLGARGETAAQLAGALHLAGPESAVDGLRLLSAGLARLSSGDVTCHAPNTMWVQAGLPLVPEFTAALAGIAAAAAVAGTATAVLRHADFVNAAEDARLEINAVIAEQTAGKIAGLLPPHAVDKFTRLVLANAVYLKAAWAQPFPAAATADAPFYPGLASAGPGGTGPGGAGPGGAGPGGTGPGGTGPGGTGPGGPVDVPMMHRTARLGYRRGAGYQAVTLPYAGGLLAMAVVVPDGPLGPLEETLAAGGVGGLLTGVTPHRVSLALPRFKAAASFSLGPSLMSLGVAAAFDRDKADFSGITTAEPLAIGAAVHQALIDVDENGTEAAAATAVGMVRPTAVRQEGPPIVVTVDRPFLFAIIDAATGRPLFLGRITNPLAD